MPQLNKFRSLVSLRADQGEVRCKSGATIITVIDAHLCAVPWAQIISRNTHQARRMVIAFLDMKSVAVYIGIGGSLPSFDRMG